MAVKNERILMLRYVKKNRPGSIGVNRLPG